MTFKHLEYLVPSVIALVTALYPLPWHLRTRNIATLSMIFWMTLLNFVHTVNCAVWDKNAIPRANVWGDISTALIVGYNFALPTAHLVLAKQLESYTTLRARSPLYDSAARRRHRLFDLAITLAAPILGILLHLSNMDRRFYVVESFGPMPATYWNTWGVIWMAIVPILIAGACAVYTVMALVNIHLRRQQMLSMIASDASVNRDQFYRLLFLTLAELGTCGLRAIFNLMSYQNGPQPLGHFGPPEHNLSRIESVPLSLVASSGMTVLKLSFFTVVACSYVFFLCFATSTETKRFYNKVAQRLIPCWPESSIERMEKLGSIDTGRSQPSNFTGSNFSKSPRPLSPTSPTSKDVDISLEEMLGTPTLDKGANWQSKGPGSPCQKSADTEVYQEELADALYLPPMQTDNREKGWSISRLW